MPHIVSKFEKKSTVFAFCKILAFAGEFFAPRWCQVSKPLSPLYVAGSWKCFTENIQGATGSISYLTYHNSLSLRFLSYGQVPKWSVGGVRYESRQECLWENHWENLAKKKYHTQYFTSIKPNTVMKIYRTFHLAIRDFFLSCFDTSLWPSAVGVWVFRKCQRDVMLALMTPTSGIFFIQQYFL